MKFCLCQVRAMGNVFKLALIFASSPLEEKVAASALFILFLSPFLSPPPPSSSFLSSLILGNYCNFCKLYTALFPITVAINIIRSVRLHAQLIEIYVPQLGLVA